MRGQDAGTEFRAHQLPREPDGTELDHERWNAIDIQQSPFRTAGRDELPGVAHRLVCGTGRVVRGGFLGLWAWLDLADRGVELYLFRLNGILGSDMSKRVAGEEMRR